MKLIKLYKVYKKKLYVLLKPKIYFWVTDNYGRGKVYREIARYPKFFPIYVYSQHGVYFHNQIENHELTNKSLFILYFEKNLVEEHKRKNSNRHPYPIYTIDPFAYYVIKNKIMPNINATGLLFFLSHSTHCVDMSINWNILIQNLNILKSKYSKVTVCLYYLDVDKFKDKLNNAGYNSVCVGKPSDRDFIRSFFTLIRQFRLTASNSLGSYAVYSVLCGIPFLLIDKNEISPHYSPKYSTEADSDTNFALEFKAKELFSYRNFSGELTQEQLQYAYKMIGYDATNIRTKLFFVFYVSLIHNFLISLCGKFKK